VAWLGLRGGQHVAARQVASFKEALHELNPSIFLVLQPGNHDIGQQPKAADIECYRSRFGDDYFAFWVGGVMYISLNSQYYRDDLQTRSLREQQDVWVRKAFQEAVDHGAKHLVMLSHVPPFVKEEDEEAGWANWNYEPRQEMLAAAAAAGAKLWLSGHYHSNAEGKSKAGIEVITTSACGGVINWTEDASVIATKPFPDFSKVVGSPPVIADARHSGMRLVRVTEQGFTHRWLNLADVPETLDAVFAPQRPSDRLSRFPQLADVMGLGSPRQMGRHMARPSSMDDVVLPPREPRRAQTLCTLADHEAVRQAAARMRSSAADELRRSTGSMPEQMMSGAGLSEWQAKSCASEAVTAANVSDGRRSVGRSGDGNGSSHSSSRPAAQSAPRSSPRGSPVSDILRDMGEPKPEYQIDQINNGLYR